MPDGETTFSEVVLKVVGCFPSNLNWESSVYGFCNFCLLFLYFSFKIVNVHNIFEGFDWGLGKYCYLCSKLRKKLDSATARSLRGCPYSASPLFFNYS